MKFIELKANLKKEIKNLYIINGNDSFLISEAINIFKHALVQDFEEFNYQKLNASDFGEGEYKNLFATLPFCSEYKLIVLENVNNIGIKAIEEFYKQPFYNVVVVLKDCDCKFGETVSCDHLDASELTKWLKNYLQKYELTIDNKALDYIIDISNNDLAYLNSELIKVVSYLDKGENVTIDVVKMLFTKNESYFVYNLTTAIDKRDKASAFSILNSLREDNSIGEIFTFMGSYFRKMFFMAVKPNGNDELATILKTKPYAIQKAREYITKNGKSFYINLYDKYVNLDYEIKSGKITPLNAIYSILM